VELIKIESKDGEQFVNARDLHKALGIKRQFSNWIEFRVNKHNLKEGCQYKTYAFYIDKNVEKVEYHLTLDTAKFLAGKTDTEIGDKIQWYLVEAEKKLRELASKPKVKLLDYRKTPEWIECRARAIVSRKTFADTLNEVKADLIKLDETNRAKWIFSLCTDDVYRKVFGKTAKKIREEYGCKNLREVLTPDELEFIGKVEEAYGKYLEAFEPVEAREKALPLLGEFIRRQRIKLVSQNDSIGASSLFEPFNQLPQAI
jgi:phage anti-repressor protein